MKFLLALSLVMFGCQEAGEEQPTAEVKIQPGEENSQTTTTEDWRYAKYRFSLAGHKDVLAAVRVAINSDNEAIKLELKDLTEGRETRNVEVAPLTGKMNEDGNVYNFTGTSSLVEGEEEIDYGGTYTGSLTLNEGGTVADNACCGDMIFKSKAGEQANEELILKGEKVDEDFGASDWEAVVDTSSPSPATNPAPTTCEDFKLVFSELKDVKRGEKFNFTVSLQYCDGKSVTTAEGTVVVLYYGYNNKWYPSTIKGKKLDADGNYSYSQVRFHIGQYNKLWESVKYKASVEIDHDDDPNTEVKTYTGESNEFTLSPAADIAGSCPDDKYKLVVTQQPTQDVAVGTTYAIEVTLKCDGVVVSDIKKDTAANAPVTLLQFQQKSTATSWYDWRDSSVEKRALTAGTRIIKPSFKNPATLQYKIGVTINGNEHKVETDPFNVTEP